MENYDKEERQLYNLLIRWGMSQQQAIDCVPRIMTWIDLLVNQKVREELKKRDEYPLIEVKGD